MSLCFDMSKNAPLPTLRLGLDSCSGGRLGPTPSQLGMFSIQVHTPALQYVPLLHTCPTDPQLKESQDKLPLPLQLPV
jgi:hypothetical protein